MKHTKIYQDKEFAARIRLLMGAKNITLRELAEATGLSVSAASTWRRGRIPRAGRTVGKLAGALGVSREFLLEGRGELVFSNEASDYPAEEQMTLREKQRQLSENPTPTETVSSETETPEVATNKAEMSKASPAPKSKRRKTSENSPRRAVDAIFRLLEKRAEESEKRFRTSAQKTRARLPRTGGNPRSANFSKKSCEIKIPRRNIYIW